MKKNGLLVCFFVFVCSLAFVSCKKESLPGQEPATSKTVKKISGLPGSGGSSNDYVYQDSNGNFYTLFGRGFGYGSYFLCPLTVNPGDNGQAWSPDAYGGVDYMNVQLFEYHEYDGYFTVSFLKSPGFGGSYTDLANYYTAFNDYISGATDANGAYKQFSLPSPGVYNLSDDIDVYTGHYVIDENSPTHVSIAPITSSPGQGGPVE